MVNFTFGTNGKLIILGVPILKYITVSSAYGMSCSLSKGAGFYLLLLNDQVKISEIFLKGP